MIAIDESYADAAAPNADAAKNGRGLVLKNRLANLHVSEDGTLLFGECQGSGKKSYQVSVDFLRPDQPTYRCTCPSRQFPCKHGLALLYAFAQKKPFTPAPVPADLREKREKLAARAERKAAEPDKPKQVNTAALAKKIKAQLAGIDVLERLTHDLIRLGIGNMNDQLAGQIETQANRLGDAYLPGARVALLRYTRLFTDYTNRAALKTEAGTRRIHGALDQLARLHAIIKQGRAYLTKRLDDPNLAIPTDTAIAAWLGHAWTLAELKAAGLVEHDAELLQLAFDSHADSARQELVETGIWMALADGRIHLTQNLRPYKALKHVRGEDSFHQVAQVKELCVYPGGLNRRVRWDAMTPRPVAPKDFAAVRRHGRPDFAAAVKEVRSALKSPLADKFPILALNYRAIGRVGDVFAVEDAQGERLVLSDAGNDGPPSCHLLPLLPKETLAGQTLIARFRHDLDAQTLRVKPLTIVTEHAALRLTL